MTFNNYLNAALNFDLKILQRSINNYSITTDVIESGKEVLVSSSNSIEAKIKGDLHQMVSLNKDFIRYFLNKDSIPVMSNEPLFIYEYYPVFQKAFGKCLFGGLGIGLIHKLLLAFKSDAISSMDIVELSPEVISLCGFEDHKVKIIQDDVIKYIYSNDLSKYNFIFIDIGNGDELYFYEKIYLPMKKFLLENYPLIQVMFFREDTAKFEYLSHLKQLGRL
jgi:hypothetical protein